MRIHLALLLAITACGDNGGKGDLDAAPEDSATTGDAPVDGGADADIDAPPGTFALTVKNVSSWCSISVNGGAASTAAMQVVDVAPGAIPLVAKGATGFKIADNMWHHTDGDTGTGETGTVTGNGANAESAVTATIASSAKCVWVCCPFLAGNGCEPNNVPEQCP